MGADRGTTSIHRFLLRLLFLCAVLVWSFFGNLGVLVLSLVFLVYSIMILILENRLQTGKGELPLAVYADVVFVGALVALSGGWSSEFHLLFYFVVVLKAPYRSWYQAIAMPAAATAAYLVASGLPSLAVHGFEIVVRIGLLWFLPLLLRVIGIRSVREKERAERLSTELARTHDEIRRYTAELEKANSEKERRLEDITLIHQFVMEMREMNEFDVAFASLMQHAAVASEAPWSALVYTQAGSDPESRLVGDPPREVREAILSMDPARLPGEDGHITRVELEKGGDAVIRTLVRRHGDTTSLALYLAFPEPQGALMAGQMKVLSAFMDAVELEMEVLRLQEDLRESNLSLSESNRHLMRLHELQAELSQASLVEGGIDQVVDGIQDIMAHELFELDRLNLFLPDEEGEMLQCRTSVGIGDDPVEEIRVPMDERGGAISRAFREGRTIFYDGEGKVPDDLRLAAPFSRISAIRSRIFVIVPLVDHRGEVLGVIGADRKYSNQPIPASTVTMLEFFARHLAMVISQRTLLGNRTGEDAGGAGYDR